MLVLLSVFLALCIQVTKMEMDVDNWQALCYGSVSFTDNVNNVC